MSHTAERQPKSLTVTGLLAALVMCSALALEARAQCVQCTPAPPGWMCTGATSGGGGCITKGLECTLVATCFYNGGDFAAAESQCQPKALGRPLVGVPDGVIREVGRLDPHAAIALLSIRDIKLEFSEGRVNLPPIEITAGDVEKRLTLPESAAYFAEQRARAGAAFARQQGPIVYAFQLERDEAAGVYSLRLSAVNPPGASSSFELALSKLAAGRGADSSERFVATSWRTN